MSTGVAGYYDRLLRWNRAARAIGYGGGQSALTVHRALADPRADGRPTFTRLHDIVIGKLSKRGIDLRNVDRKDPAISPLGHATQELLIKQGLEGEKAKEIIKAIKENGFKVQSSLQDRQVRVTGKSRDELQGVIAFCRSKDFEVGLGFGNFRD